MSRNSDSCESTSIDAIPSSLAIWAAVIMHRMKGDVLMITFSKLWLKKLAKNFPVCDAYWMPLIVSGGSIGLIWLWGIRNIELFELPH